MRYIAAALAAVLLVSSAALAHHAFTTQFDPGMPVILQGVVWRVDWTNPHAWVHLRVKGSDGRVESWKIEAAPPPVLGTFGWRKDSLLPGAFVVVEGFRARDGSATAHGRDITLADGRRLCANMPCRCCKWWLETRDSKLTPAR